MVEWLGDGLQNRTPRFNSWPELHTCFMFKLKIQMNLGELSNDDPTARAMSKRIVEHVKVLLENELATAAVNIERVACVNEQRKDGRNILAV